MGTRPFRSHLKHFCATGSRWPHLRARPGLLASITSAFAAEAHLTTCGPWQRRWEKLSLPVSTHLPWSCILCWERMLKTKTRASWPIGRVEISCWHYTYGVDLLTRYGGDICRRSALRRTSLPISTKPTRTSRAMLEKKWVIQRRWPLDNRLTNLLKGRWRLASSAGYPMSRWQMHPRALSSSSQLLSYVENATSAGPSTFQMSSCVRIVPTHLSRIYRGVPGHTIRRDPTRAGTLYATACLNEAKHQATSAR